MGVCGLRVSRVAGKPWSFRPHLGAQRDQQPGSTGGSGRAGFGVYPGGALVAALLLLGEGRLRAQGQHVEPQDATPALPKTVCFNQNHGIWDPGRAVYGFTGTPCDKMRWGFSEGGQCLTKSTVLSLIALSTGAGVATDGVLTHPVVLARAGGAPPAT